MLTPTAPPPTAIAAGLVVHNISSASHADFAAERSASFLQTPHWAAVKPAWRSESLGWFEEGRLVGAALVLYRPVPGTRRSLAYVPEGPTLPWPTVSSAPARWLDPFVAHLRSQGAFAARIGPTVPVRRWNGTTAKAALADPAVERFDQVPPDEQFADGSAVLTALESQGWAPATSSADSGFGAGQPNFSVRLPLSGSLPELLAGTNQQWRRNLTRSVKEGVAVREGNTHDLPAFHRLYRETAGRDGFTPRPAAYFTQMASALGPSLRIYMASRSGTPLAAALVVQVGDVCWYSYGASTSLHRQAQASTALQWRAISDAHARGARVYDLRGIADTLCASDRLVGLLRFKLATGGSVTETAGEWDLALNRFWYKAFRLYLRWRS